MSASREALYAAGAAQQQQHNGSPQQQDTPAAAAAAADGEGAEAMDVDGVELQQVLSAVRGCLVQLREEGCGRGEGEEGQQLHTQLTELQQQAAQLCQ